MLSRVFTILSALSLVLCVAVGILWVRSHRVQDEPTFARRGGAFWQLTSENGDLVLDVVGNWPDDCNAWYRGAPDDHFGPYYWRTRRMDVQGEWAGITLMAGSFSISTSKGRALVQLHAGDDRALIQAADNWPRGRGVELRMPHGYYFALFILSPLAWGIARVRREIVARRRRLRCLCPYCGYDLRATPDRCPECGVETKRNPVRTHAESS